MPHQKFPLLSCRRQLVWLLATIGSLSGLAAEAANTGDLNQVEVEPPVEYPEVVSYAADFFERYRPTTALDMVQQLPGFQLDDGDVRRGLGGTGGNVLINDRYPSSKRDTPSDLLARIPAAHVEKIELIRGQMREIDMRGRSIVANLILLEDAAAATRWEFSLRKNFDLARLAPIGGISVSHRWRNIDYSAGVDGVGSSYGDPGVEKILDGRGEVAARRIHRHKGTGYDANGYLSAASWLRDTLLQFNSTLAFEVRDEQLISHEIAEHTQRRHKDVFDTRRDNRTVELGGSAERMLGSDLLGKAIVIHHRLDQRPGSAQRRFDSNDIDILHRRADTTAAARESIGRLEFDWTAFDNHVVQINLEAARNTLDNQLVQVVDLGDGFEAVAVPGANTRVKEVRGDFLVSDTWSLGDTELDFGLGAEFSTISQGGDAELERSFSFLKPHAVLTFSVTRARQTLVRMAREVSQLDFNDFVSATVFEDNDLALGNPDLRPETTWVAELVQEWRHSDTSVLRLKIFHHWISDVEDLLPISSDFEAPGNIGDGRRWGFEVETAWPLGVIGLDNARIDIKGRLQDSTVVDPVTGADRVLSSESGHKGDILFQNENRYSFLVDFRQDFERSRVSWGWDVALRAKRPLYKVNELDIYDEGVNVDTFVETTRWKGVKVRLSALNLLNHLQSRDRTVYIAARRLSPVSFRELRDLTQGTRLLLTLSGAF